jgi:hypothetical protein
MHLKILLLTLVLSSCKGVPKFPDISVCAPILAYVEQGVDLDQSYVFCVSRQSPSDEAFHKRIDLKQFLLEKPRLLTAQDLQKLDFYEKDVRDWAGRYCSQQGGSQW